ncbi:MAG: ABC transporter substrate-binding protein [Desulfobacteraceae bacterium]|nr:ABC transporter substrate-binding protein [Desulfobacteraceae bacterium]
MKKRKLLSPVLCLMLAAAFVLGHSDLSSADGKILIYSPWKDKVMKEFNALFKEKTGIKAENINISTGESYARLTVEKGRPQADIWHSVRASYLADAEKKGLIAPYEPPNAKYALPRYRYPKDDYIYGTTMYPLVFCYNKESLKKMKQPHPKTYVDLLDPKWKGKIVMPHPAASGTGYAFVTTILQMYRKKGEKGTESRMGWDYLKQFNDNVAQYTRSGSAPSKFVGRGEYPVGITFFDRAYRLQEEGYPLGIIYPSPTYAEPSCTAIVANSPNPEGAKAFLNFMLSKDAQELAKKTGNYSVRPDVASPKGAPALAELEISADDYIWAAKYRKKILGEFSTMIWKAKKKK